MIGVMLIWEKHDRNIKLTQDNDQVYKRCNVALREFHEHFFYILWWMCHSNEH
jgi:hypothetical protein